MAGRSADTWPLSSVACGRRKLYEGCWPTPIPLWPRGCRSCAARLTQERATLDMLELASASAVQADDAAVRRARARAGYQVR
jgi:hypothetical protein